MRVANRRPPSFPPDEEIALAQEASRQLGRMLPKGCQPLQLVTNDNRHEMISIPTAALRVLVDALTQLGQGRAVTVVPEKAELTTREVADYLNVSRPYVVGLIDSGQLAARKVGPRRRVALEDLLRFEAQDSKRRREALDEVTRLGQELGL